MIIHRRAAFVLSIFLLAWMGIAQAARDRVAPDPSAGDGGFVVALDAQPGRGGRHALRALARTAGTPEAHRARDPATDWTVRLIDPAGATLSESTVADPRRPLLGSADPAQPLSLRFADHPLALLAEVRDAQGRLRAEVALDADARVAAEAMRVAAAERMAGARRGAAKRARDSASTSAQARDALERQLSAQARLRADRARACVASRRDWHAPERIPAADPCRPPFGAGGGDAADAPRAVPSRVLRPAPKVVPVPASAPAPRRGKLLPADARVAGDHTLTGRLVFPAGDPGPSGPVTVYAWNAPGPGYGYGLTASPPDFTFTSSVVDGADVELEVESPAPYLATRVALGVVSADVYREIAIERGVTVSGRIVFGGDGPAPTGTQWVSIGTDEGTRSVPAEAPGFEFAFAVRSGTAVTVSVYPPPPFLPVSEAWGTITAPTVRDIAVERGVMFSGRVVAPAGTALPTTPFWLYVYGVVEDPDAARSVYVSPPDFSFETVVRDGAQVRVWARPPAPFLDIDQDFGVASGDLDVEVALRRGVVVTTRARFPQGAAPPVAAFPMYVWDYDASGYGMQVSLSPPAFEHAIVVEPGVSPRVELLPPSPFLGTQHALGALAADTVAEPMLRRGVVLRGQVSGPAQYSVRVRDLAADGWTPERTFATPTFEVAMPVASTLVEVTADGYLPSEPYQPVGGRDGDHVFELHPQSALVTLTLDLRDGTAAPLAAARAEAWRGGRFVVSGLSDAAGRATLPLTPGNYEIRVWPDSENAPRPWDGTTRLFAEPALVTSLAVSAPATHALQVPASQWMEMRMALPTEPAFPGCQWPFGRLELLRDDGVVARGPMAYHATYGETGLHRVVTGAGMYALRYSGPGGVSWQSEPFRAASGLVVPMYRRGDAAQYRWSGTLRTAGGAAVPDRDIVIGDESGITLWPACPLRTDAAGRFDVPICEGCLVAFQGSGDDPSQRRIVSIDGPVTASRAADARLREPLAFTPLAESGTTRIYGPADAPLKLIFLAEGYTAERETFTDSNGNGIWDGVQWIDADGDGLYDEDEPYAAYGEAEAPVAGTDPRTGNEVIQDLNGDGVLSLDDRALFERSVRDYLRGLFSSDRYANWRGAYQASAVMAYSAQAGMDHGSHQRDTLFGASFVPGRGLVSIDYTAAMLAASEASPGYTVVVVMINQPVPYGRVNSFVLASGGPFGGNVNDNVAAHEFGHNVVGLADEYHEFAETWTGADFNSTNSTRHVVRDHAAWGHHVLPSRDGRPTKPWMPGAGFFEGSSYHPSGAYRPSQASLMRFMDSLLFNAASIDPFDRVHAAAVRDWPGRLEVDGSTVGCRAFVARWDVAALGVQAVDLRRDAFDGERAASGGAAGSATVRPGGRDLYLVDAVTGVVLDIAAMPVVRCAGTLPGKPTTPETAPRPSPTPVPTPLRPRPAKPSVPGSRAGAGAAPPATREH